MAEVARIEKGLVYTTQLYEQIANTALEHINHMQNEEAKIVASEYGIYYNAIAGLLRAGVLCSRVTGTDGFPEIRVVSGSKVHQCRESILRVILGNEADFIISPYEDTFESYVDLTFPTANVLEAELQASAADEKNKNDAKALAKQHKAEIDKIKSQYENEIKELKAAVKQAKTSSAENAQPALEPVIVTDENQNKVLQQLKDENAKLLKANEKLQNENKQGGELLKQTKQQLKLKSQELEEHNKYVYDPNYDHYYSDELPGLIEALEFTHKDLMAKFIAMAGCVTGLVISALLIL